ncbi:MAG TPA: MarP family serine protease [Acidimicrobiia bacterium]|nr:MarP family serine protease [Acidimicrobiia bacterium]
MNLLDLLVVLAAVTAGWVGYRLGFIRRVTSWAGLVGGVVLGVLLVDDVANALRGTPPRTRLLGALAFVLLVATVGHGVGYAVGGTLHRRFGRAASPTFRRGDRLAGAVVGVTGVLALVWLLIPALASAPGWPARAVRDSAVVRAIDQLAPDPPPEAETLGRLVGDQSFPEVFDTLTSPDAGSPPAGGLPADVAARVRASVVKVEGAACDNLQEGTGFVAGPGLVVTNAHVVAGETRTRVDTTDGRTLDANVVAFDPDRDLALLRVGALDLPTLSFGDGHVDDRGSLFGHPQGGPLRESPMRIAEEITARGTNIERTASVERDVFVLAAATQPGDSGSPVVDQSGRVLGVVFAFDLSRPTTAYALTDAELSPVLAPALANPPRQSVSTGPCLGG